MMLQPLKELFSAGPKSIEHNITFRKFSGDSVPQTSILDRGNNTHQSVGLPLLVQLISWTNSAILSITLMPFFFVEQNQFRLIPSHVSGLQVRNDSDGIKECSVVFVIRSRLLLPARDSGTVYLSTSSLPRHSQHFVIN